MPRTFRSDNNAGLCPEALQAIIEANDDAHEIGYGDDSYTQRAIEAFQAVFGSETSVWFVATGTAANTLAVASLTQPWEQVICHAHSHYNDDESTAPERITHCRMAAVHTDPEQTKLTVADIERTASNSRGDVHQPQPGVVSLSNVTEFGTVYTPDETRAICDAAHAAGFAVHIDGARFANAVASLGCDPRDLTILAGVDALSFGGTKNGLACGEAVLFFPQHDRDRFKRAIAAFPFHRKGTGHLLSKHRFVAAPFAATLRGGAWLKHAGHANAMTAQLARGLDALGLRPRFPVQANGLFLRLSSRLNAALSAKGHGYYPFGDPDWSIYRLMCSFNTSPADVDGLIRDFTELATFA